MVSHIGRIHGFETLHLRRMQVTFAFVFMFFCIAQARAQQVTYDSGSTGADGAFNPNTSQQIQVPPSGVFNFTTVNIPAGLTITFIKNAKNTPVTILASGNVTINSSLSLSGGSGLLSNVIGGTSGGGIGAPGGFDGGRGGTSFPGFTAALSGQGPGSGGGGSSTSGTNIGGGGGAGFVTAGNDGSQQSSTSIFGKGGLPYGSSTLVPLIGGSGGGGGGGGASNSQGTGGGGGGGAIFIASSGTISFGNISILAMGGGGNGFCSAANGGGGAGGAVRIAATTITGSVSINVSGGGGINGCGGTIQGGNGSNGAVRIEAYNFVNFSPSVSSAASNVLSKNPNPPGIVNLPQLSITSVAGVAAPSTPSGLYDSPDIILSPNQSNPITAVVAAKNVPLNSNVKLTLMPEVGAQTVVQASALSGTLASSTTSASITLGGGTTRVTATVTIDLTAQNLPPLIINGERVNRIEVTTAFGGKSETTYITESGRRLKEGF